MVTKCLVSAGLIRSVRLRGKMVDIFTCIVYKYWPETRKQTTWTNALQNTIW